ncbi:MAG: hypothetical protein R3232_00125 [Clostridia bacterium]|nr:hypothetical protein [Clostridia bacterium]
MARTKLTFDVMDIEYFERLGRYISANYGMYFEITDEKDSASETFVISDYINRRNSKGVFLVKEDKGDVSKFSPASEICAGLMEFTNPGTCSPAAKGNILTISVTSVAGGAGKSVISKAICCHLAEKGQKILYINFNPFSTHDGFFSENDKNSLTRLRYYLSKNDEDIMSRIKSLASRNVEKRIDYINNKEPSEDGFISITEASNLVDGLSGNIVYDSIVFDLSSYPESGQMEIMRRSSANILVCRKAVDDRHTSFRKYLEKNGVSRIFEVMNFNNSGDSCIPEAKDIFTAYPGVFWNAIDRLCKKLEEKNGISG